MTKVPFIANSQDDLHCYEASLKMIMKYFKPELDFSWEQMESITGKEVGLWTWPQQGIVWLSQNGFEVINIEIFDYPQFVREGGDYLISFYGKDGGLEQIKHSNVAKEQQTCSQFIRQVKTELRLPNWDDIRRLLSQGYLLGCLVNSSALNGKEGYVGHFIVLTNILDNSISFNDPGLPPVENRRVDLSTFEKAWAYPDNNAKNLIAVKLKE